jgi:SET domain-containing protein 6
MSVISSGFCRFNHKTGAEDVHFTSVLSDSDSDSEPSTPDETLEEATKKKGDVDVSPKPKRRGNSNPNVDESPKIPKEAINQRGKPASAESLKPAEVTYKRRAKANPIEEEEEPTKEGDAENAENWEGSSDVLEMIMVKDVAKGTEVGYLPF